MTTAHRPTWKAAYGLSDNVNKGYVPTRSYSARDQPSYLKLKQRQLGQGSLSQLKQKDFKSQLLKRQQQAKKKKNGQFQYITGGQIQQDQKYKRKRQQDDGVDYIIQQDAIKKKVKKDGQNMYEVHKKYNNQEDQGQYQNPFPQDADSSSFVNSSQEQQPRRRVDSQQQQSDEQDSQQLLRQYEKIKEQRQKQQLLKREQKHRESMANRDSQLLKGNPLIDSSYSLSKRWYEDTVFRNQAKKTQEKKSYINDYVRSDFHRKFMKRFVGR